MNCIATRNILDYFIDNRLTSCRTEKVKSHLDRCSTCAKEAALLHSMKKELAALESPVLLVHLRNTIYNRILSQIDIEGCTGRFNWQISSAYGIAMAYLILMLITSIFSFGIPSQTFALESVQLQEGEKNG